jgi:hypothetical protein
VKAHYQTPCSLAKKERPLMKKENPKMQGAKKRHLMKKEATPKLKELKKKDIR